MAQASAKAVRMGCWARARSSGELSDGAGALNPYATRLSSDQVPMRGRIRRLSHDDGGRLQSVPRTAAFRRDPRGYGPFPAQPFKISCP